MRPQEQGFSRPQAMRELMEACRGIRMLRARAAVINNPTRRQYIAGKLRTLRNRALLAFMKLPETGSPGCCKSPWVFESVRV